MAKYPHDAEYTVILLQYHRPSSPGIELACAKHLTYHRHSVRSVSPPNLHDLIRSLPAPIDQSFAALELIYFLYSLIEKLKFGYSPKSVLSDRILLSRLGTVS
jgi:hypothetical protein